MKSFISLVAMAAGAAAAPDADAQFIVGAQPAVVAHQPVFNTYASPLVQAIQPQKVVVDKKVYEKEYKTPVVTYAQTYNTPVVAANTYATPVVANTYAAQPLVASTYAAQPVVAQQYYAHQPVVAAQYAYQPAVKSIAKNGEVEHVTYHKRSADAEPQYIATPTVYAGNYAAYQPYSGYAGYAAHPVTYAAQPSVYNYATPALAYNYKPLNQFAQVKNDAAGPAFYAGKGQRVAVAPGGGSVHITKRSADADADALYYNNVYPYAAGYNYAARPAVYANTYANTYSAGLVSPYTAAATYSPYTFGYNQAYYY